MSPNYERRWVARDARLQTRIAVGNGTVSLRIAVGLLAAGSAPRTKSIIPAYPFFSTASGIEPMRSRSFADNWT